jgi:outer membrane protein assembly factor BamB
MLALYRSGRQAEALEVYREARRALDEELGLEPGEELRDLEGAILRHDPALAPPPRAGPRFGGVEQARRLARSPRALAAAGALLLVVAGAAVAALELMRGSESVSTPIAVDSVAVIDPRTNRIVGQVPVGSRPVAIAAGADGVWVANADDETVSRIDPVKLKVVRTIGIGVPASDIAVGVGSVWVGSSTGTLVRIDPRTDTVVEKLDLGGPDELAPYGIYAVATGAGAVWAGSGSRHLLKIDPRTNEVLARVDVAETPADVAFGAGDVWVAHIGGRVLRIEPRTSRVTGAVSAAPFPMAITAGEGSVWVTAASLAPGGLLWRVDPATLTVSGGVTRLSQIPHGVTTGGGAVWVAGGLSGTLIRVGPLTGAIIRSIPIGHAPLDVAYGDGRVWLTVGTREAAS